MLKIIIRDKKKNIIRCSYSNKIILCRDKLIINNDQYLKKDYWYDFEYVSIFKFLEDNFYSLLYDLKKACLRTLTYFIISFILMFIIMSNEIEVDISQVIIIIFPFVLLLKDIKKLDIFDYYGYLIIAIICYFSISNSLLCSTLKYLSYEFITDLLIFIFYALVDLDAYNKSSIDVRVINTEKNNDKQ